LGTKKIIVLYAIVAVGSALAVGWIFSYVGRGAPGPKGLTTSVLFIGNSLTYVNDLPQTLSDIARSLGDTAETDMYAPGGYTLKQDAQDPTALDKIASRPWDFVVLQEQSELPALQDSQVDDEVTPYALELASDVRQAGPDTKVVFFETWAYKGGDPQYCASTPTLCDFESMQDQLSRSYGLLAQRSGGLLAPVGEAWRSARDAYPEIELYQSDGRHPSAEGTYLAAAVFYMVLFKKDVAGAASLGIDPAQAKILQQVARQVVFRQ